MYEDQGNYETANVGSNEIVTSKIRDLRDFSWINLKSWGGIDGKMIFAKKY